jgi:hypothetical protein
MKNNEKIRKYLEGELTGDELISFEAEIKNSAVLKKEINSYRITLTHFKKLENINVENSYFVNILPGFREKLIKQKPAKLKPAFAFGGLAGVLFTLLVIFLFSSNEQLNDENIAIEEINSEGLNSYLNTYSNDFSTAQLMQNVPLEYDSLFSSMIMNELDINGNSGDYFVDVTNNEFYEIINELSNEEIDGIYSTLIDKKIY